MEYEKVFAAIGVAAIGIFAMLALMNAWNDAYGTSVGNTFNTTLGSVEAINNITSISGSTADATQDVEGSGTSDPQTNLVTRGLRIVTILPTMLGLVPDLFYSAALVTGIPDAYLNVAVGVFVFSFTVLFAYVLLLGVRRLF